MTPIEILATVFAILILVKVSIFAVRPETWMKVSEAILNKKDWLTVPLLILAGVVGYYVFTSLSVVEVAAVMLFASLLTSLSLLPYFGAFKIREFFGSRSEILRRSWWLLLIWVGIAVWVLYAVFV